MSAVQADVKPEVQAWSLWPCRPVKAVLCVPTVLVWEQRRTSRRLGSEVRGQTMLGVRKDCPDDWPVGQPEDLVWGVADDRQA